MAVTNIKPATITNSEGNQGGRSEGFSTSLATSSTPQDITTSPFRVDVPESFNPASLDDGVTVDDVFNQLEQFNQDQGKTLDDFDPSTSEPSPFNDPQAFILSSLYGDRDPSRTEELAGDIRESRTDLVSGTEEALTETRRRAEETTGIGERSQALAETNEKIAQRQTRFRRELRAFELDAERRGVAREFFQSERQKLEADATAELADLYIIQNAQSGNVEAARDYIDTAVNNRYRSIEIELAQKQAELEELIPTLQAEEKERAMSMQIALQERARNLNTEKEEATAKRELALQAAANGAPSTLVNQITNAESVNDAIVASSPYVGLLQRQAAARQASNAALTRRAKLIELAQAGDPDALKELGVLGQKILQDQADAQLLAEYQRNLGITAEVNTLDQLLATAEAALSNESGLKIGVGNYQGLQQTGEALKSSAQFGPLAPTVAPFKYAELTAQKEDFLNDVAFIAQNVAFDKFIDLKSQGVAFGGTSNAELKKIDSAAAALSASLVLDPLTGQPIRISGSEAKFKENLQIVTQGLQLAKTELQDSRLQDDERAALLRYLSTPQ